MSTVDPLAVVRKISGTELCALREPVDLLQLLLENLALRYVFVSPDFRKTELEAILRGTIETYRASKASSQSTCLPTSGT